MEQSPPRDAGQITVIDPNRASIARVYDAALGGKDNYDIDRQVLAKAMTVLPEMREWTWSNRNFLARAVRFLAQHAGIDQFIDCGSGLPSAENTHEVAQRADPDARIVYIDNDPVVLAHGNALLVDNDNVHMVDADIFRPEQVLGHEIVSKHIDWNRPVALLQVGTFHHYLDDDYADVMHAYIDKLPSGSYVAISHFCDPETPELTPLARKVEDVLRNSPMGSGVFRTRDQIRSLVDGLEIIPPSHGAEPAIVTCADWWPNGPHLQPISPGLNLIAGVVARKP